MSKRTPFIIVGIALVVVLAIAGTATWRMLHSTTSNAETVRIYLPEGSTYTDLCDTLQADGVVHNFFWFSLFAKVRHLTSATFEGSYVVQPATSTMRLAEKIGRKQQDPLRLTLGKFRTPEQLNAYLASKLMHSTFAFTLDNIHTVHPDTYEVYWTISPAQFEQRMTKEDERFWQQRQADEYTRQVLLPLLADSAALQRAVVVLASIVEEETNNNAEKPLIASVYLNRLRRGMPLQADPTVKYATGDFTLRRILNSHLATESPFNTYLYAGLPPAPICTPSAKSIDAVLHAKQTNYLYFCASDQMDGTHRFASTLAEHNRNAAAFHAALNRKGILR